VSLFYTDISQALVSFKKMYALSSSLLKEEKGAYIFLNETMFGRGICEKYQSRDEKFPETKFPSPFGSGNFSSLDWYFSQIPLPNMSTTFYYSGIKDWNSLPESVKNCNNKNRFKTNVKGT
jgi:hypothetical protein